jgi:hypothetical protein
MLFIFNKASFFTSSQNILNTVEIKAGVTTVGRDRLVKLERDCKKINMYIFQFGVQ